MVQNTNFREVQDARIRQLAQTLKSNGLAASETEAIRMATSMTATEKMVTQNMDVKREAMVAQQQRPRPQPSPDPSIQPSPQPWEKEVQAQEGPARRAPAPTHANQALNAAISNVQEQFQARTRPKEASFQTITVDEAVQEPAQETIEESSTAFTEEPKPVAASPKESPARVVESPLPPEPAVAQRSEEEDIPERTVEIRERAPKQDISKMQESKVSLADVFNFSKR